MEGNGGERERERERVRGGGGGGGGGERTLEQIVDEWRGKRGVAGEREKCLMKHVSYTGIL